MTRDEIIKQMGWPVSAGAAISDLVDRVEAIVRKAEQAEREACADIASNCCDGCADAMRARGQ
jgi:hypothetical protein